MKRWAFLTVGLYLLCAAALIGPLSLANPRNAGGLAQLFFVFVLPALALTQAALLIVPVAAAQGRPAKRRSVAASAIMASLPMAALALAAFWAFTMMCFGEHSSTTPPERERLLRWLLSLSLGAFWLGWGIFFYLALARGSVQTVTRWLLRGSVLELLVAVPSHIVTRARGDCCAPLFTLLGIATGLSVALLAFGPGLFFLFAKKFKDKQGKRHDPPVL